MDGWIKLHRKIMDTPLYLSEPFTRAQAWIDLLLLANHKESFFYVRGNKVTVGRGQIGTSSRTLASRWQWSRGKVERFLQELEESEQIKPQKTNVITLISICNYDDYQKTEPQNEPQKDHRKTTNEPQKDPNNNDNKVKNENNDKKGCRDKTPRFIPPTLEDIKGYVAEKGLSCNAEKFFDFYQSKGWMVGKNRMKDWRAAVRNWARTEKQDNKRDGIEFCNDEWK